MAHGDIGFGLRGVISEEAGRFFGGDFPFLHLLQNLLPTGWGCCLGPFRIAEQLVDQVESLADRGVRNSEFLFGFSNVSPAAEKHGYEVLEIGRQAKKGRNRERGIDLSVAGMTTQARNLQFPVAEWASRN
jgi:hypothetical protein